MHMLCSMMQRVCETCRVQALFGTCLRRCSVKLKRRDQRAHEVDEKLWLGTFWAGAQCAACACNAMPLQQLPRSLANKTNLKPILICAK